MAASGEMSIKDLIIGYGALATSISVGGYIIVQALYHLHKARTLRALRAQAEVEIKALREKPRQFTPDDLARYDGKDPRHCLLIAVKGRVLDVHEAGYEFYGPEGPYKHLAGKDGSRALALMSLKAEDATNDLSELSEDQLGVLDDWATKLYDKYPMVGMLQQPHAHAAPASS